MSKLAGNSIIYTVFSVLQKGINFFLLPIYTVYLTTEEYGTIGVVTSLTAIYSIFFGLVLNGAATRFYFKYQNDKNAVKELWGTLFTFTLLNSFSLFAVFFVFKSFFVIPFAEGISFYPFIFLGLISSVFNTSFIFFQSCVQAKQDGFRYAIANFLFFALNLFLILLFVVLFKKKAEGVLAALSITTIVFFIYTIIFFSPQIRWGINKKYLKDALFYSLPLLPHALSGWIFTAMDRIFINNLRSASEVGIYSVGFQFAYILNVIATSVQQAYSPWFMEQIEHNPNYQEEIRKKSSFMVNAYALIAMGIIIFAPIVLRFMTTSSFHRGVTVIPFLVGAAFLNSMYYIYTNVFFISKTYLVSIISFSGAGVILLSEILFIPRFGIIGAAFSNFFGGFLIFLFSAFWSYKVKPLKINWFNMGAQILLVFVVISFQMLAVKFLFLAYINFTIVFLLIIRFLFLYGDLLKQYTLQILQKGFKNAKL